MKKERSARAIHLLMLLLVLLAFSLAPIPAAHAATITVAAGEVTIAANGLCSLREAIINANDDGATHADCVAGSGTDTIQLATGSTYNVPDSYANADGPTGLPSITTAIAINGNGSTITRNGTGNYRVFHIATTGNLTFSGATVSNGSLSGFNGGSTGSGGGGGGGAAGLGGAFYNRGTLALNSAIIAGNRATGGNGGTGGGAVNVRGGGGGGGVESAGATNAGSGTALGGGPNGGAPGGDGGGGNSGQGFNGSRNAFNGGFAGGGGGGGNASAGNGTGGTSTFGGGGGGRGRSAGTSTGGFGGGNGVGGGGGGLGAGGAIFNRGGTVTVANTVFANNRAIGGLGGATVTAGTNGQGLGGAIFNRNGTITINNSTFQANIAANGGGSHYNLGDAAVATLTLRNTLMANTPAGTDCAVNVINAGSNSLAGNNNLIESNSGCPAVTVTLDPQICSYAIAVGSPAIDAGDNATCEATDIRGIARPDGATCDIGAYEFRSGLDDHTYVWDGGGGDNNWSTATNWDNDNVPLAGNDILFNTTSTTNATMSAGGSGYAGAAGWLCSVTVDTGYTGIITMTRALRTNDYSQDDGTYIVGDTLTVLNTMTHTGGRLQQTLPVNNANVPFLQIDDGDGSIKYRGLDVNTIPTGGTNLGDVTAVIRAIDIGSGEYCTDSGPGSPAYAERCYEITPTTNAAARVRLWALTASELNGIAQANLSVFHFNSGWNELTVSRATGSDGGNYSYAEGDTTSFSPFLLGQAGLAPTAVTLQSSSTHTTTPVAALLLVLVAALMSWRLVRRRGSMQ